MAVHGGRIKGNLMSKFATMAALMLVTGYAAWCLIEYPNTDVHFIQAAYFSGAIAVILVFVELIRLILRGVYDAAEWMRVRRQARKATRAAERHDTTVPVSDPVIVKSQHFVEPPA
jgi:uncharacterized oligopeptide transporter (OPT) family protein